MKTLNIKRCLAIAVLALPSGLLAVDTDGDGLDDAVESNTGVYVSPTDTGTDPSKTDSDGDGAGDWYEVTAAFTNPNNAGDKPNIPYPLPGPGSTPPATNKPVKVYILSGQSNMVGMGNTDPLGTPGTLATITRNEHKFTNLLNGAGWSVRNDVAYRGIIAAVGKAPLTVGQGSSATAIGPELGFGHVMGYFHDEPVLLLKSSQGGRALGWDFLPPGSVQYTVGTTTYAGYGDSPASWTTGTTPVPTASYGGYQYDQCFLRKADWAPAGAALAPVFNVTDVLDNFATEYPQYAAQGFEIAGFVWWQGWNDGLSYTKFYADRYETNMVQFIRQIRSYYESRYPGKIKSKAPFVLATCGFGGWSTTYPTRVTVANAQLAVSDPAKYPEFAGNVKTMESRNYWRDVSVSPSDAGYHYNRNAETFMLVGDALGRGMIDLLGSAGSDTDPPAIFSSSPADNATGVATSADLVLTFNESIALGAGNITLKNLTDATQSAIAITDATQVSAAGSVLTINPTEDLAAARSYAVRIEATAIKDLSDNPFAGIADDTTWNFTTAEPDITAPTPDPMTWASVPAAVSSTSITMTAGTASDPSGVEYYFACAAGGGHDSGWQDSPSYTDTGLSPSTAYSYTARARDKSPNANETAPSTPAAATTHSAAPKPGGALIYEPFADSDATLAGNTPGLGLSGTWQASSTFIVNGGSLTYGTLPVSGNQVTYGDDGAVGFGNSASSVAIDSSLSNARLLDDGATLWFSIVVNTPTQGGSNPDTGFSIGTDQLGSGNNLPMPTGGQGIGWSIKNDKLRAATWNSAVARDATGRAVTRNTTMLVVGEIIWGADAAASDRINLYLPDASLARGSVVSTYAAVLNQASFDTITSSLKTNSGYGFDEIRFGASYEAVMGATVPAISTGVIILVR